MSAHRLYLQFMLWGVLYFCLGYLSLYLGDPASRGSFLWFPAGFAVSVFLLTPRCLWLPLFMSLYLVRTLLDVTLRHSLETSLIHSVISLANDLSIAWCIRHFMRPNDRLYTLIIWLFATLVTSAVAAVIGVGWVVRYHRWRQVFVGGIAQLVFALFLFLPFPTHHHGTLSQFIGVIMILGAIQCLRLTCRALRMRDGTSVFNLLEPKKLLPAAEIIDEIHGTSPLVVHIWTPEGSSPDSPVPRPVINRYIAAVDINGVISTGHAALEVSPDLYISLYPAVEIDRSPTEFFNALKAVQENNVPGKFQKSYPGEAAQWCESDRKIIFKEFNAPALRRYWENYRETGIYNLTWRNCSSSVAYGLEAALAGVLSDIGGWLQFLRLFFMPELWIAAQLRKRATTMAWTPGLMLDYARALHGLVHPVHYSWFQRWRQLNRTQ